MPPSPHGARFMQSLSISNISSRSKLVGIPMAAAYASSKAAIRNHSKTVARYCAQNGWNIRCDSNHPAAILTPVWEPMLGQGPDREARMATVVAAVAVGRGALRHRVRVQYRRRPVGGFGCISGMMTSRRHAYRPSRNRWRRLKREPDSPRFPHRVPVAGSPRMRLPAARRSGRSAVPGVPPPARGRQPRPQAPRATSRPGSRRRR